jgi:HK97 family phage portal protein
MDFTPISFSPEDASFIESRHMTVAEMSFMFGLDPSDLSATIGGISQTYANIEQRSIERITNSYGPWMRRFEQSWSDLIPGGNYVRFTVDNLLRTDAKTRAEVHEINLRTGIETLDEARATEHKKPIEIATAIESDNIPKEEA